MGRVISHESGLMIKIRTDSIKYLKEENMLKRMMVRRMTSDWGKKTQIKAFYRSQIAKFEKIGIGGETEFKVKVTEELMAITRKRLSELY